jgi:hypothetical protein
MPLGLMPGMKYDEREVLLDPDDTVLFYTDGLVEAHDPQRKMFGFPHLKALLEDHPGGPATINYLLDQLRAFTGPNWEQEDDATLVVLREPHPYPSPVRGRGASGVGISSFSSRRTGNGARPCNVVAAINVDLRPNGSIGRPPSPATGARLNMAVRQPVWSVLGDRRLGLDRADHRSGQCAGA